MALLGIIRRWHLRDQVPLREIAKRLGISRNTVRRYLRSEITEPAYAERQSASAIDPYAFQLSAWLKTEAAKSRKQRRSLKQLHQELIKLGFKGSYDRVAAFARQWREGQTEWVNSARKRTDQYQDVARNIVAGAVATLDAAMNAAVTDMYLLWTLRHERYLNPLPDIRMNMVAPEREMSIDTQEILEANGYVFASPDNTLASRFMTGLRFTIEMGRERQRMAGKRWGILKATDAEFLVPDNFSAYSVLPLSPTIALLEGHADQQIGFHQVADINGLAVHGSRRYYFARDITRCPILKHRILDGLFQRPGS